jgi:LPS-assembly protein
VQSFNLLRAIASYGESNRRGLSAAFGMDFNFAQRIAHQVLGQVSYNFGCFSLDVEFRRFALGDLRRENQVRVALSLANVGSFGNLKPRERLY